MRALKSSPGRFPSSKLTACLRLDTAVTMWFLILCLALSLAGTGETVGKMWKRGVGPDSYAALVPPTWNPSLHPSNPQPSPDQDMGLFLIFPGPTLKSNPASPCCHLTRSPALILGPCSFPGTIRIFSSPLRSLCPSTLPKGQILSHLSLSSKRPPPTPPASGTLTTLLLCPRSLWPNGVALGSPNPATPW